MLGEIIDSRYRLLRVLGQGGMGAVYEAEHTGTGRRVAIKMILGAELSTDTTMVQRFQREARAAGSIETPHVVQVLDTGMEPVSARPYLVMELLHGEDLRRLLKRCGPLAPDVALRVIGQACVGLLKAHEAGVVHRDIKPGNLFLSRRDGGEIVVKVVDFGIAKLAAGEALTATGDVFGSPQYMSPEQVKGGRLVDHRTDIWSIGVVLYELLAGRRPHAHRDNIGAMLLSVCNEPAPPIQDVAPWVPPAIAHLVHDALTIDMNARHETMSVMLEALRRLVPDGLSLRADMLVPLTAEQRARVTPRAPSFPGSSSGVEPTPEVTETSASRRARRSIDTTTTIPFNMHRTARRHTPPRAPMLATLGVLGVLGAIGAGGAYKLARTGDDSTPREALVAPARTTSAAGDPFAAAAPSEAAPAPTPSEATVRLTIEPASATATIDDREVPATGGRVELRGVLGSSHRVRVRWGKNETVQEVLITESGPFPSTIRVEAAATRAPPASSGTAAGSPGAPSTRPSTPGAAASPAALPAPASSAAPPPPATASPVVNPAPKPADTGVSRAFDE